MMHKSQFDSYDELIKAGAEERLARTIVKAVEASRIDGLENVATKKDIENTELKLELKINALDGKVDRLYERLDAKVDKLQWMVVFNIGLLMTILGVVLKVAFSQ